MHKGQVRVVSSVFWTLEEPAAIAVLKSTRKINAQTRKPKKKTARKWKEMEISRTSVGTVANQGTKYLTIGRVRKMNTSVQHVTKKRKALQQQVTTIMKDCQVKNFY